MGGIGLRLFLGSRFLALEVSFAALTFDKFIVLFAHDVKHSPRDCGRELCGHTDSCSNTIFYWL